MGWKPRTGDVVPIQPLKWGGKPDFAVVIAHNETLGQIVVRSTDDERGFGIGHYDRKMELLQSADDQVDTLTVFHIYWNDEKFNDYELYSGLKEYYKRNHQRQTSTLDPRLLGSQGNPDEDDDY